MRQWKEAAAHHRHGRRRQGRAGRLHAAVRLGVARLCALRLRQAPVFQDDDAEAWAQGIALLSDDHKEGVRAFFDTRKPQFKGS